LFNAFMVEDRRKREHLCAECFFERAIASKVRITLVDLRPCPFNMSRQPPSWFDFFAKGASPELVATWQRWLEWQSPDWRQSIGLPRQMAIVQRSTSPIL
jgi:hypothetical protein